MTEKDRNSIKDAVAASFANHILIENHQSAELRSFTYTSSKPNTTYNVTMSSNGTILDGPNVVMKIGHGKSIYWIGFSGSIEYAMSKLDPDMHRRCYFGSEGMLALFRFLVKEVRDNREEKKGCPDTPPNKFFSDEEHKFLMDLIHCRTPATYSTYEDIINAVKDISYFWRNNRDFWEEAPELLDYDPNTYYNFFRFQHIAREICKFIESQEKQYETSTT